MKNFFAKIFKKSNAPKLRNKAALKQGGYAIAITAVVVAACVAVNVLFAILAERVNLDIDISLSGDNTLSEEYIESLVEKIEALGFCVDVYTVPTQALACALTISFE